MYCQLHTWLNWDLIHVLFHCPENVDKYTQVFVMDLGLAL